MKAVILAGGLGTRLAEETVLRPKPMVEIGGKPILWHIMKGYAHFGITDFVICLGYKGYMVKEYFANYLLHMSDVTIDIAGNRLDIHQNHADPWKVTLVDTGDTTQTVRKRQRADPPHILLTTPESLALLLSYEDSGKIFRSLQRVIIDELLPRLYNTLFLAGYAALIAIPLSVGLGILAAINEGKLIDKTSNILTLITISIPEFFIAYLMIIYFVVDLGWFPSLATVYPGIEFGERVYITTLPAVALTMLSEPGP